MNQVHIAVLNRGYVRWELSAWLGWLILNERRRSFSVSYYDAREYGGVPVSSNRNKIIRDRPPDTDLLMIDADTIPHNQLFNIATQNLDIVLAPVPIWRPDNPDGPCIINLVTSDWRVRIGEDIYQEIPEGGSGVIYIDHKVLDAGIKFGFSYDQDGIMDRGEDHNFCKDAREKGFKVYGALGYLCGHAVEVNLKTVLDSSVVTDASTRRLQVVVAGTGRSASGFAARWLTSLGIPCGHEFFYYFRGREGAEKQLRTRLDLVGDSSWMAAPYLNDPALSDALVIHQVRHPRKVIESCMRHPPGTTPQYLAFLEKMCPAVAGYDNDIDKAAARWVYWNRMIQEQCKGREYYFWRVEDGTDGVLEWLQEQGLTDGTAEQFADTSYNKHPGEQVGAKLEDIDPELRAEMLEQMEGYGYQWTQDKND